MILESTKVQVGVELLLAKLSESRSQVQELLLRQPSNKLPMSTRVFQIPDIRSSRFPWIPQPGTRGMIALQVSLDKHAGQKTWWSPTCFSYQREEIISSNCFQKPI